MKFIVFPFEFRPYSKTKNPTNTYEPGYRVPDCFTYMTVGCDIGFYYRCLIILDEKELVQVQLKNKIYTLIDEAKFKAPIKNVLTINDNSLYTKNHNNCIGFFNVENETFYYNSNYIGNIKLKNLINEIAKMFK